MTKIDSLNISSEARSINIFALEFRIYQKRVCRNLVFRERAVLLHLASNTRNRSLLSFSAIWTFAKLWLIKEENI